MTDKRFPGESPAILAIDKKIRISGAVIFFVVLLLYAIIFYHMQPADWLTHFIPDASIRVILGISLILSLTGLTLAVNIWRQVLRIVHEYSNRIERLLHMTRDLREEVYGDILIEKILDHAMSVTGADAGSILLVEGKSLVFKVVKGEKAENLVGTEVELGKGISGWVATTGETLRVADATIDERFNSDIDALTGYLTKAMLCVPLRAHSRVIGVIELLNSKGGYAFRQRDEEIITYLAGQAALSILKTRFYEDQKNYEIHLTEMLLDSIDAHVTEKRGHSRRVARYSTIIAKGLNMPDEQVKKIYYASLLHDVGFMKINPEETFRKEEYVKHPVIGFDMIKPITFYSEIAPLILHHHERYDGHGYPSQLKGEMIPLGSRIIAIAEAFDAMVSKSSYKVPVSFAEAISELRHKAGSQFDRELVEIFAANIAPQQIRE